MTLSVRSLVATLLFPSILLLFSCSTPSLVEIARRRQATADGEQRGNARDDVRVRYDITDWDVLNYTDEVKRKLANRANIHAGLRYGSATGQVSLAALAGAALTAGWGVATASGLGLGASYLFGLSRRRTEIRHQRVLHRRARHFGIGMGDLENQSPKKQYLRMECI
jgi:hypothetical protein